MSKETTEALVEVYYDLAIHAYAASKTAELMRALDKGHQEAGGARNDYALGVAYGNESEARAFKRAADRIARKLTGEALEGISWDAKESLKLAIKTLEEARL